MTVLVAATSLWTAEAIDLFTSELMRMDTDVGAQAVRNVILNWDRGGHPNLAVIVKEYQSLLSARRRDMGTAIDYSHEHDLPTFEEGIEIAKRAFEAEQRRRFPDREPNWALFGKFAASLRPQPAQEDQPSSS
jgi:hypothetical protein